MKLFVEKVLPTAIFWQAKNNIKFTVPKINCIFFSFLYTGYCTTNFLLQISALPTEYLYCWEVSYSHALKSSKSSVVATLSELSLFLNRS